MRALLWFLAVAVCLAVALVARAPATLLDTLVATTSGDRVRLTDAQGTLWDGAGVVRFADAPGGQPIAWRAEPASIVSGALTVMFGPGAGAPRAATLRIAPSRLELRQGPPFDLPVAAIARWVAPGAAAPAGMLRVEMPQLALGPDSVAGQVRLTWQGASLPGTTSAMPLLLGTVTADLADHNGALAGPVRSGGGEVEATGSMSWQPPGRAAIDVTLAPRADLPRERAGAIESALARYGRPDGRGGFRIAYAGQPR